MRTNAATVVSRIAFSTPDVTIHANFGASFAGRFRHKLLRKTVRRTSSWLTMAWNSFTSAAVYVDIRSFELSAKKSTVNSDQNRPGTSL